MKLKTFVIGLLALMILVPIDSLAKEPEKERIKFGLALSGGGLRAAAFSYGVMRGLGEITLCVNADFKRTGIGIRNIYSVQHLTKHSSRTRCKTRQKSVRLLAAMDFLSAVSGGSITASYYMTHKDTDFKKKFGPLLGDIWATKDIFKNMKSRMDAGEGLPLSVLQLLGSTIDTAKNLALFPFSWMFSEGFPLPNPDVTPMIFLGASRGLITVNRWKDTYEDWIFNGKDIPFGKIPNYRKRTELLIHATDVKNRLPFTFDEHTFRCLGVSPKDFKSLSISMAAAASSALPILFEPLNLEEVIGDFRHPDKIPKTCPKIYLDKMKQRLPELLDGGLHENLGLAGLVRTIFREKTQQEAHRNKYFLLIVNAAAPAVEPFPALGDHSTMINNIDQSIDTLQRDKTELARSIYRAPLNNFGFRSLEINFSDIKEDPNLITRIASRLIEEGISREKISRTLEFADAYTNLEERVKEDLETIGMRTGQAEVDTLIAVGKTIVHLKIDEIAKGLLGLPKRKFEEKCEKIINPTKFYCWPDAFQQTPDILERPLSIILRDFSKSTEKFIKNTTENRLEARNKIQRIGLELKRELESSDQIYKLDGQVQRKIQTYIEYYALIENDLRKKREVEIKIQNNNIDRNKEKLKELDRKEGSCEERSENTLEENSDCIKPLFRIKDGEGPRLKMLRDFQDTVDLGEPEHLEQAIRDAIKSKNESKEVALALGDKAFMVKNTFKVYLTRHIYPAVCTLIGNQIKKMDISACLPTAEWPSGSIDVVETLGEKISSKGIYQNFSEGILDSLESGKGPLKNMKQDTPLITYYASLLARLLKRNDEAFYYLYDGIHSFPDSLDLRSLLGYFALLIDGNAENAIKQYEEAIEIAKDRQRELDLILSHTHKSSEVNKIAAVKEESFKRLENWNTRQLAEYVALIPGYSEPCGDLCQDFENLARNQTSKLGIIEHAISRQKRKLLRLHKEYPIRRHFTDESEKGDPSGEGLQTRKGKTTAILSQGSASSSDPGIQKGQENDEKGKANNTGKNRIEKDQLGQKKVWVVPGLEALEIGKKESTSKNVGIRLSKKILSDNLKKVLSQNLDQDKNEIQEVAPGLMHHEVLYPFALHSLIGSAHLACPERSASVYTSKEFLIYSKRFLLDALRILVNNNYGSIFLTSRDEAGVENEEKHGPKKRFNIGVTHLINAPLDFSSEEFEKIITSIFPIENDLRIKWIDQMSEKLSKQKYVSENDYLKTVTNLKDVIVLLFDLKYLDHFLKSADDLECLAA